MRKKQSIEEHKKALIDLYRDQLENRESDTTFMKAVLVEAIRQLYFSWTDPQKIEDWVVQNEKNILSTKTFKLKGK